jgi:uncharacterized alkaline shock family protein YloU
VSLDPAARGTLTISETAVARIAGRAATEVQGAGEPPGRGSGAAATVRGSAAALRVRASIDYPLPVRATVDAVRSHLIRRVGDLTGLTVSQVDITVAALRTRSPR